jgi:hypothetical protein
MAFNQELIKKLEEAANSGKYLITVTWVDKSKEPADLQHYWSTNDFPIEEVTKSLDQLNKDYTSKQVNKWK